MDEIHIRSDASYKGGRLIASIDNQDDLHTTVFSIMVSIFYYCTVNSFGLLFCRNIVCSIDESQLFVDIPKKLCIYCANIILSKRVHNYNVAVVNRDNTKLKNTTNYYLLPLDIRQKKFVKRIGVRQDSWILVPGGYGQDLLCCRD